MLSQNQQAIQTSPDDFIKNLELISKLRDVITLIKNNLSQNIASEFKGLEIFWSRFTPMSEINVESRKDDLETFIARWQHFINNDFITEIQLGDIIFKDITGKYADIKERYKQFSQLFHPDKCTLNTMISLPASNMIMSLLNQYKARANHINANVNQQFNLGNQCFDKYQEYKHSNISGLRDIADEQLIEAIGYYKGVVESINEDFRRDSTLVDDTLVEFHIQTRIKLAECYECVRAFFHAQIYIISALQLAERYANLDLKRNTINKLEAILKNLKNHTILPSNPVVRTSVDSSSQGTAESGFELVTYSSHQYRGEMRNILQHCLTVSPEDPRQAPNTTRSDQAY